MRMTGKELEGHQLCKSSYIIKYETRNSHGEMIVKTSLYNKYLKKFTKLFKDAVITSFEEVKG